MRRLCFAICTLAGVCLAQTAVKAVPSTPPTAPAPLAQLKYIRFMLLNVASLDHDAKAIAAYEDSLVKLFGLTAAESAVIHAAGQLLHAVLAQHRQTLLATVAGKASLSAADQTAIANLEIARESEIFDLSKQITSSVRPETAGRLKAPGMFFSNGSGVAALRPQ